MLRQLSNTLILLAVVAVSLGCGPSRSNDESESSASPHAPLSRSQPPRLVLLYSTCTLNKDFLEPYDPQVSYTPHLAAFARNGVVFERHQTEAGQSGTAFAALYSGLYAEGHGIYRHPSRLEPSVELIGETFARQGFEVATWLEHGMASAELGYAQGAEPEAQHSRLLRASDADFLGLLEELHQNPDLKALILVNFTVTHGPYQSVVLDPFCDRFPALCGAREEPGFAAMVDFYRQAHAFLSYDFPATKERSAMSDANLAQLVETTELLYRSNVWYLDELFGKTLEAIQSAGLWDQALVAFTADHGETLYRDGTLFKWTHGHQLAPEVLNVPLILHAPGVLAGRYASVTRSIDVFPTLAGLAGLSPPAGLEGVDLSSTLHGLSPAPALDAFSHTALIAEPVREASQKWSLFRQIHAVDHPSGMWIQLRRGDMTYQLRRGAAGSLAPAVFDLASDPHQRHNLFDSHNREQQQALKAVVAYRERLIEAYDKKDGAGETEEVERARQEELLRSLGYIE